MIQLPFRIGAYYCTPRPNIGPRYMKSIRIPSKKRSWPRRLVHDLLHRHVLTFFYQKSCLSDHGLMLTPNNSQHQRSFLSEKPIGFKPSDSNFSWQQQPRRTQWKHSDFGAEWAWWALRCLVNTLRVRLTHTFSSAQLWCAIRHGEDVGADFGGNPTFITITRQRFQPCSQIGPFPQVGVKIENTWNHHLAKVLLHTFFSRTTPLTKILRNLQNTLHPKQIPLQSLKQRKENQG